MSTSANIGGIILAGGKSSRMGEDKGLMNYKGKPMIQWVIEVLEEITEDIIIISNNPEYEKFGYPVFKDLIKNVGPLGGIVTGLNYSKREKNFILSCDTPEINSDLLKHILSSINNSQIAFARKEQRTHPLIGIYSKDCLEHLKNQIDAGNLKVEIAIEKLDYSIVECDEFDCEHFRNVNRKEDLG